MTKEKWPPSMSEEDLKEFVHGVVNGQIFTNMHIKLDDPEQYGRDVELVFMPLIFGAFKDRTEEDIKNLGVIWEWMDKAGPRSCNGMPGFFSMRVMNKSDWERALKAIEKEEERRKNIEI